MRSYDVKFWAIRPGKAKTRRTYEVRWKVGHVPHSRTLGNKAQAENFLSDLRQAARPGEVFDSGSGLPGSLVVGRREQSWLEFCLAYVDMKWPSAAPKTRDGITDALAAVIPAQVGEQLPDGLADRCRLGTAGRSAEMSSSAEHAPASHVTPHVQAAEQARRQGIQPIASVDELAFPGVWESDEELDDFLAHVRPTTEAGGPRNRSLCDEEPATQSCVTGTGLENVWQVLGSNQRRLSRRFYRALLRITFYYLHLHKHDQIGLAVPTLAAMCTWLRAAAQPIARQPRTGVGEVGRNTNTAVRDDSARSPQVRRARPWQNRRSSQSL
jgi:hypothetical protein